MKGRGKREGRNVAFHHLLFSNLATGSVHAPVVVRLNAVASAC